MSTTDLGRLGACLLAAVACGAPPVEDTTDASVEPPLPLPLAQVGRAVDDGLDPATARPADFGCLGLVSELTPIVSDSTFRVRIFDLLGTSAVPGVRVCVHGTGAPSLSGECVAPGQPGTTDERGEVWPTLPWPGPYSLRVFPGVDGTGTERMGVLVLDQYTRRSGETREGAWAIEEDVLENLMRSARAVREEGTAAIAGEVRDCGLETAFGVRVRLARADGSELESDALRSGYTQGTTVPVRAGLRAYTHADGAYWFVNVPIDPSELRLEAWARTEPEGPERLVGCELVPVLEDHVSVQPLWPTGEDHCR